MVQETIVRPSPLLDQTVESLNRVVGARQCFIYLSNSTQDIFFPFIARGEVTEDQLEAFFTLSLSPDTDLLLFEILKNGPRPRIYSAKRDRWLASSVLSSLGISEVIALPIRSGEQLLAIYLAVIDSLPDDLPTHRVEMASFAANTLALALENARLYQETRSRLEESQSLHQISLALLQKLTLEETLEIICTEAQRLTRAMGSSVSLLEDQHWLRVAFRAGKSPFETGRVPVNDSLLGLAVRRGEPLLINNQEVLFPGTPRNRPSTDPLSLLAVPLRLKGETIGVLDVVNKRGGFSPDDVRVISLFAGQASMAIEHARLSQESRRVAILEERQRLARDLHDSVNQNLYGMNLYAQAALRQVAQGNVEAAEAHLKNIQASAQEALNEMRVLIFELRPPVLESEGLVSALEARLKSVEERTGLKTGLKVRLAGRLPASVEDELYRIAQEGLNNVIKHAQANHVTIHLIHTGHTLLMRIEDDGIGFDACKGCPPGTLGLKAMQERTAAVGGKINIESQPGSGTVITVEVTV